MAAKAAGPNQAPHESISVQRIRDGSHLTAAVNVVRSYTPAVAIIAPVGVITLEMPVLVTRS